MTNTMKTCPWCGAPRDRQDVPSFICGTYILPSKRALRSKHCLNREATPPQVDGEAKVGLESEVK